MRSYSPLCDTGVSNRVLKNRDSKGPLQAPSLKQNILYIYSILLAIASFTDVCQIKTQQITSVYILSFQGAIKRTKLECLQLHIDIFISLMASGQ